MSRFSLHPECWRSARCAECRPKAAAYARRRRLAAHLGRPTTDLVDAAPLVEHVQHLAAAGWTRRQVAAAAGLHRDVVDRAVTGRAKRVRGEFVAAVLALPVKPPSIGQIPAVGARRRLQALIALGWTRRRLAAATGHPSRTFHNVLSGAPTITAKLAKAITDLYEQLWDTPPPCTSRQQLHAAQAARAEAERRGWPPPMAWDDDEIDNPRAHARTGDTAMSHRILPSGEDILAMRAAGLTRRDIAARYSVTPFAVRNAEIRARRALAAATDQASAA